MNAIPLEHEIEYPTSDGQLMAESSLHQNVMVDLIFGLRYHYASVPDIWVGGNLFLCYEQGNPAACIAPDLLVARGVTPWLRPNYLLWEETIPSLVAEVTSRKTRREDQTRKKAVYERIGVEEYVLFDPFGEYLRPRLQGYRLDGKRYRPIPVEEEDSLVSRTLDLTLRPEGQRLRVVDNRTGKPIPWPDEFPPAFAQKTVALEAAQERIQALEEELSRLRKR
jgi:Uma2 family endonuclease